jgi:hypothetical protein
VRGTVDGTESTPEDVIQEFRVVGALVGEPQCNNGIATYWVPLLNEPNVLAEKQGRAMREQRTNCRGGRGSERKT